VGRTSQAWTAHTQAPRRAAVSKAYSSGPVVAAVDADEHFGTVVAGTSADDDRAAHRKPNVADGASNVALRVPTRAAREWF
jgi:hypothetical protein